MKIAKYFKPFLSKKQVYKYKIIDNCSDLKLNIFVKILTDGEITKLIIEGEPPILELEKAWNKIYSEYCSLTNSSNYTYVFKLNKEIFELKSKVLAVKLALQSLVYIDTPEAIEVLRKCGYKYEPQNKEKCIKNIHSRIKTDEVRMELKVKELEDYMSKQKNTNTKIKESDFTQSLITLSKYMGTMLQAANITVTEYCTILNQYTSYCDTLEKQAKNGKK